MDFINQVSIACSNLLITDAKNYIDVLYDMTAEKCINLCLPNHTDYNVEIIERELKNTQEYFFDYLKTCEYALEKCQMKQLKRLAKEEKHKIRLFLYGLIGKEVTDTNEN
jgi:hypothetical protein